MLKRTLTGLAVLALVGGLAWLDLARAPGPGWATATLGALLGLLALDELLVIGAARPGRRVFGRLLGLLWLGLVVAGALGPWHVLHVLRDLLALASLVCALVLALQIRQGPGGLAHRMAGSLWFQVPWTGGVACLVALALEGRVAFVVSLVIVAKCSDIGAYFAGKFFGRRPLAPRISPKKTVEGLVGGLLVPALAGAWLFDGVFVDPARGTPLPGGAVGFALHGLLLGLLAVIADLSESLIKRSRDVKDSGRIFGEAGGALDLVDTLLLAGPVALAYTAILS